MDCGFDTEAGNLRRELKENLGIKGIRSLRLINRYDVDHVSEETFEAAKTIVFSEPGLDEVYEEHLDFGQGAFSFGVEFLPGQYDQRADSAAQCIRLINEKGSETDRSADNGGHYSTGTDGDERLSSGEEGGAVVRYAKWIAIVADLTAPQKAAIKKYCINPVDSREASKEKPAALDMALTEPPSVETVENFRAMDERQLRALIERMGFAMRYSDLRFTQEYFRSTEHRDPTVTELRVIDTYWSDHCRHTTFLTALKSIEFEEGIFADLIRSAFDDYCTLRQEIHAADKNISLMDIATIGAKYLKKQGSLEDLDESDEINACSIKVKAHVWDVPTDETDPAADISASKADSVPHKTRDGMPADAPKRDQEIPRINERQEDWLVMFKNETHNHPTEIEPFGGAATCLGGAIRDPLSGRAYVYQAMRLTGSGDPRRSMEETLPGKLSQYQITRGAAKGYSSYGNQIGLATGLVDELYDEGYVAKRLEIGAVVGAVPADCVRRESPSPGDVILVVGGRTGRDGLGGATGSSKEHTEQSILTAGAEVQKGNPPVERNIQRLFRRPEVTRLIKKCNDFGAGGVSVAIGELADSIDVNLDRVPKKYEGLDGTELAISESQERMAVVVERQDVKVFTAYAMEENVEVTAVAKVTDTGRFRMTWRGDTILDLSRDFLNTNGVNPERTVLVKDREMNRVLAAAGIAVAGQPDASEPTETVWKDSFVDAPSVGHTANRAGIQTQQGADASGINAGLLLQSLSGLSVCSRQGLIECFDSTIGRGSILMPLGGKHQMTPALGMAAKLPVKTGDTDTVTLMSWGFDPKLSLTSPFHGAMYAVLDSVAKIAGMGGDISSIRLSFQEYFEKLGKVPTRWAKPFMSVLGALKAQIALGIPAIGGKDSMSGTFNALDVPPTLVSFALSVSKADGILSPELKAAGNKLVLVQTDKDANGIPDFGQFKENMQRVSALAASGKLAAASTIGLGGLFASLAKMALGNGIGAILSGVRAWALTAPNWGSLLIEVPGTEDADVLFEGANYRVVGETTDSNVIEIRSFGQDAARQDGRETYGSVIVKLKDIKVAWESPLKRVFPISHSGGDNESWDEIPDLSAGFAPITSEGSGALDGSVPTQGSLTKGGKKKTEGTMSAIGKPRVFMPVFPGTNCEMDTQAAFENAGAIVRTVGLVNLTAASLDASIESMAEQIKQSQIIMIPGGFSGGDEPEGSAKFIVAVFRNPKIREAVTELLEKRDGLILGICNGFQALIKLGLLPFGSITAPEAIRATLTYNTIGRHVSRIVRTKVCTNHSPWLAGVQPGAVYMVPVSHGEGRFVADGESLRTLMENGQIATQYVDIEGHPSMEAAHNPNGSVLAVEGLISPDGRVFGKMGHSERVGPYLYRNVPGEYDMKIFKSGLAYFK